MEEIWKDIEGYEGLYQISNLSRIKALRKAKNNSLIGEFYTPEKLLSPHINKKGYFAICLSKERKTKSFLLHRLIAIAFIPSNNYRMIINHIDGNKLNNAIENLEWCTYSENMKHAYEIGLKVSAVKGENNPTAKLKESDVIEIKKHLKNGVAQRKIAKMFNVSKSLIGAISVNKAWRDAA